MRVDSRAERIGQHTPVRPALRSVIEPAIPPSWNEPPAPPFRVVQRSRLLDRISQAVQEVPLTLVSAPAGSGKTVLLAAWARSHPETPVAWLSLAGCDDTFIPDVRSALAAGTAEAEPIVLVLDGAERVWRQSVLEQLVRLLDTTGDRLRVVMTTRVDPPLPLHRYRLDGTLAEIRYDDLAFTGAEVEELLGAHDITEPEATTWDVLDRTEGWAAGVRLAALALRAGDHRTLPLGFATDYLAAEVFGDLGGDDRDFLLRISLVDDVTPELGAALADRPDADEVLHRMAIGNTFVQPVHGRADHYRIHPLFREFLRARLDRTLPSAIGDLQRRAADWYGANGRTLEAVRHSAERGDWARAAGFVVNGLGVGDLLLPTRVGSELARSLSAMPDADSADVQLVRAAIAVADDDVAAARESLARCAVDPPVSSGWAVSSAVVTTMLHDKSGSIDQTLLAARAGRDELAAHGNAVLKALVLSAEGTAYLRGGDLDVACTVLADAVRTAAAGDCEDLRLRCLATLALAEACRGHLSRGQVLADTAERLATESVAAAERPAATHLAHAWVALERQELTRAQHSLDRARRLRETQDDNLLSSVSSLLRVRLMRDRGDRVGARCALRNSAPPDGWLRGYVEAEAAGVGLDQARAVRRDLPPDDDRIAAGAGPPGSRAGRWLDGNAGSGRSGIVEALLLARGERIRRPFTHTPARLRAIIRDDAALRSLAGWLRPDLTTAAGPADAPGSDRRGTFGAGARRPAMARAVAHHQRDRRRAVHLGQHREVARPEHPAETLGVEPQRGRPPGVGPRPGLDEMIVRETVTSVAVAAAVNPVPWARAQMAFTLAFHIILVPLGVSWAFMTLIANYRGIKRDDHDALVLAQRWSKYMAVTFAVGAVTGTVLSFEFGLLWPRFMGS